MGGQQRFVPHDKSHWQWERRSKPSAMLWLRKTFWSIAVSLDTVQQPLTKTIQVSTVLLLATHFAPRWRSIKMKLFFFFFARTTKYTHRHPGQPPLYLHRGDYASPFTVPLETATCRYPYSKCPQKSVRQSFYSYSHIGFTGKWHKHEHPLQGRCYLQFHHRKCLQGQPASP